MHNLQAALCAVWLCWLPACLGTAWVATDTNLAALESVSSLRKETFTTDNQIHCVSIGTQFDWAYLSCYSGGMCTLWDINAYRFGFVKKNPTLGSTACKTLKHNYGMDA